MSSLQDLHLECNNRIKINFNGGELSSDSGLLLLYEYINKLKIPSIIAENFSTDTKQRIHSDFIHTYATYLSKHRWVLSI